MLKQALAVVLIAALATSGCASGGGPRIVNEPSPVFGPGDRALLADYVQKLPAGSKVVVERTSGGTLKGILMKASDSSVVVQRNTRVPETPMEIPLEQVTRISIDNGGSNPGKAIGIGVAVGVGAFFGVALILAALLGD